MPFESRNPATGALLNRYDEHDADMIEEYIGQTEAVFHTWRDTALTVRAAMLHAAAAELRSRSDDYARMITLEMGKPITQSRGEVEKCAWVCDWYADNTERIFRNEHLESDASESYVRFDPLGVILAVMPWNFPFWQVFRFAAPALMAGNVALLKHASNVPGCAMMIEEVFRRAGIPEGGFRTLMIGSGAVASVLDHPAVVAATLTGSEHAGSKVAARAGERLKKTVLELGGSDPFIVLDDADIETAARIGAQSRMINTGQSCIAAKRFILTEAAADTFIPQFLREIAGMKIGDPMDPETRIGAIAREDLLLELDGQVRSTIEQGAELLTGGYRVEGPGTFYHPTVLSGVTKGMTAFDEETFGPVASITVVRDAAEAVDVANDSLFGLGASLWTQDRQHAETLAARIEAGGVFINGMVKSDPRLPFGGIKNSGYGRELSHYGIREFVNIKTVWIA
ncbi:MAG: NAD-dependent succinate-semialdehyde dehydrogenase [Bacteroidetes bacterium]|nr:NAD-dependent succinate-semialdehyde dehydrogenase [Bacteroidota bacterium]